MSDITTPIPFASGTTVTATRLNDQISNATISANAITTAKILDKNVTAAKLADSLDLSAKTLTFPPTIITGLGASTVTVDADYFMIWDSESSALKKVSRATLVNAFSPPGAVIQTVCKEYADWGPANNPVTTGTIPRDNTIPQLSTDGTAILTESITPSSASNKILVRAVGMIAATGSYSSMAIFRNTTEDAIYSTTCFAVTAENPSPLAGEILDSPGATTSTTYTVKVGATSGVCYVNGTVSQHMFGGAAKWTLVLQEIKG